MSKERLQIVSINLHQGLFVNKHMMAVGCYDVQGQKVFISKILGSCWNLLYHLDLSFTGYEIVEIESFELGARSFNNYKYFPLSELKH